MRNRALFGSAMVLAALLAVAGGVGAAVLLQRPPGSHVTAVIAGVPRARPAVPGPDQGKYRVVNDLCGEADFTELRPTFDSIGDLRSDWDNSAGTFVLADCDGSTGNATVQGSFSFQATVYRDPDANRAEFTARRERTQAREPTTTVAGLGAGAYTYVEPGLGTTVITYDANITLRLTWLSTDPKVPAPAGTVTALVNTCTSTLLVLRAS